MEPRDPVASMIPWYANGTLSPADRRRVDEHLPGCAECQALLGEARAAVAVVGADEEDSLLDHIHAQHLEQFALEPDLLPGHVADWVREHVESCVPCREALEQLERLARDPYFFAHGGDPSASVPEQGAGTPQRPSLWEMLGRALLQPAAAAAYLVVLLIAIPVFWGLTRNSPPAGPPTDWGGAVDLPVLSSTLRGDSPVTRLTVDPGAPVVLLAAEFEWPGDLGDAVPVRFHVLADEGSVWMTEIEAGRVERNLYESGVIPLLIPRDTLPPGTYRLKVVRTDRPQSRPMLDAPFEVVTAFGEPGDDSL